MLNPGDQWWGFSPSAFAWLVDFLDERLLIDRCCHFIFGRTGSCYVEDFPFWQEGMRSVEGRPSDVDVICRGGDRPTLFLLVSRSCGSVSKVAVSVCLALFVIKGDQSLNTVKFGKRLRINNVRLVFLAECVRVGLLGDQHIKSS